MTHKKKEFQHNLDKYRDLGVLFEKTGGDAKRYSEALDARNFEAARDMLLSHREDIERNWSRYEWVTPEEYPLGEKFLQKTKNL